MAKIVVADDDVDVRMLVALKLRHSGYDVVDVGDGAAALEACREERTDLVVLDLMMPVMTGLDVLAQMRADARLREVPCIILTAAGQEQQHRRAMELGATEFITKPFSPKKLYARAAELTGLGSEEPAAEGT